MRRGGIWFVGAILRGCSVAAACACGSRADSSESSVLHETDPQVLEARIVDELRDEAVAIGRVGAMAWLDSRRLAVVDESTQQIRVFDREGELVERIGRVGDGPGEFRRVTGVAAQDTELLVFEGAPGPSRVHRRRTDGSWTHRDLRDAAGRLRALGILSSGALLVTRDGFAAVTPPSPGETRRDSMNAGTIDVTDSARWLPPQPGRTWIGYESVAQSGRSLMTALPLGPYGAMLAVQRDVWLCDSADGACRVFGLSDLDWRTLTIPRVDVAPLSDVVGALREQALADAPNEFVAERIAVQFSPRTLPANAPAFEQLLADPQDGVWALRVADARGTREIQHVHADGRVGRRIRLPARFVARALGHAGIAGVISAPDGNEAIVVLGWPPEGE